MGDDGLLIPLQKKDLICSNIMDISDNGTVSIIAENEHNHVRTNEQISYNSYNELLKETDMPDLNLTDLLECAPMGKAIISYYNDKNCLHDSFRNKLVDIIMRHLFSYHCKQYVNLYYVHYI